MERGRRQITLHTTGSRSKTYQNIVPYLKTFFSNLLHLQSSVDPEELVAKIWDPGSHNLSAPLINSVETCCMQKHTKLLVPGKKNPEEPSIPHNPHRTASGLSTQRRYIQEEEEEGDIVEDV